MWGDNRRVGIKLTTVNEPSVAPGKCTQFDLMIKPVGSTCDQCCDYCYYLRTGELFSKGPPRMSLDVLRRVTSEYLRVHPGPETVFAWQGGEPLIAGKAFFRAAFELQDAFKPPGRLISNTVQTSGLLFDNEWCDLFLRHRVLVGLSLDGPPELHDRFRKGTDGSPTAERVIQTAGLLGSYEIPFNILCTINSNNASHALRIYRFLRDEIGATHIQFLPVVEYLDDTDKPNTTTESVTPEAFGRFMNSVFDEWVRQDVGRVFVQHFDVTLGVYLGHQAAMCVMRHRCGQSIIAERDGSIYACDHFVKPEWRIGSMMEEKLDALLKSPRLADLACLKADLPSVCMNCSVLPLCHGGCTKNRPIDCSGGRVVNELCEGYKSFFSHVDAPMRFMTAQIQRRRSPAEVMQWVRGSHLRPAEKMGDKDVGERACFSTQEQ